MFDHGMGVVPACFHVADNHEVCDLRSSRAGLSAPSFKKPSIIFADAAKIPRSSPLMVVGGGAFRSILLCFVFR